MKLFLTDPFAKKWENLDPFKEVLTLTGKIYRDMGDRCTTRIELDGSVYFVKIHTGVGWIEIFKNLLCLKKPIIGAKNEYEAISKLNELNINTMIVRAYGSNGWNPATKKSFIITEALEPSVPLDELCSPSTLKNIGVLQRRKLVKRIAEITRVMHENGLNHRDYYLCHFLIEDTNKSQKFFSIEQTISLIDLHRMQIRKRTPRRWKHKDLSALYYSAVNSGFNQRDAFCFMREYKRGFLKQILNDDPSFWESVKLEAKNLHHKGVRKGYHS
jgi:heptose I phosphotransferase